MSLVLPQLLQLPEATGYGLGQSMVTAGLFVAPLGLTMMLIAPLSAAVSTARGPKVTLILGTLIIADRLRRWLGLMTAVWQTWCSSPASSAPASASPTRLDARPDHGRRPGLARRARPTASTP